jgi:hypothetical protein
MVRIEQLQCLSGVAEFASPRPESRSVGKPLLKDFEMARDDQEALRGKGDFGEDVRDAALDLPLCQGDGFRRGIEELDELEPWVLVASGMVENLMDHGTAKERRTQTADDERQDHREGAQMKRHEEGEGGSINLGTTAGKGNL